MKINLKTKLLCDCGPVKTKYSLVGTSGLGWNLNSSTDVIVLLLIIIPISNSSYVHIYRVLSSNFFFFA